VTAFGFALETMRAGSDGSSSASTGVATSTDSGAATQSEAAPSAMPASAAGKSATRGSYGASSADGAAAAGGNTGSVPSKGGALTPVSQPMVVKNATIALRVSDVAKAVEALQALAKTKNVQIQNLTYTSGVTPELPVDPARSSLSGAADLPSSAQITLRVPAEQLDAVTRAVAILGTVQSQSASQDDVTAQHVDMTARLRNMQAEEARLRGLYSKAGSISELLEVEQQLSDVRGEIEAAQAQIAYLEGQVAYSTLQIALSAPGAVVQPTYGTSWGIREAVARGVQSAAAVVRAFVTGAVALSPVALLLLLAWGALRLIRWIRRRVFGAAATAPLPASGQEPASDHEVDSAAGTPSHTVDRDQ
jgi:hypothetical protein